jgi:hypothetical protein
MRKLGIYSPLIVALIFTTGVVQAGDTAVREFRPPSAVMEDSTKKCDLWEGKFDGCGILDRLKGNAIVVDDQFYQLSASVVYKDLDGRFVIREKFLVGTPVWFVLYPDNTIKSVWKEGE